MGDEMEGAVQQAAQPGRQFMLRLCLGRQLPDKSDLPVFVSTIVGRDFLIGHP
jgi:hypothetical protein